MRYSLFRQLVLPMLAYAALAGCDRGPPDTTIRITGTTMGTSYELKLVPDAGQTLSPELIKSRADQLLEYINRQMSTYDPNSELSGFNRNPSTDWVSVSAELQQVIAEGLRISDLTSGAYDITVGPLVDLWGFGPEPRLDQVPPDSVILQARERVGYWRLHTREQPPALKKDRADVYTDLSSLAKGYAVDQLAILMESKGIHNYLVSIGGDLRAKGHNGKGQPWTVAIERPVPGQRAVERLIQISDHSVSTAGDYRNFFEQNGRRYSHIIDPRTGRPVLQTLASVTVISKADMEADAIDTALMALGADDGFRLATEHRLAAFFIITSADGKSFQERYTPEFEAFLLPKD
jgi:thiamine biosynthesis lipoprotein